MSNGHEEGLKRGPGLIRRRRFLNIFGLGFAALIFELLGGT
jgi:hypothetical protein